MLYPILKSGESLYYKRGPSSQYQYWFTAEPFGRQDTHSQGYGAQSFTKSFQMEIREQFMRCLGYTHCRSYSKLPQYFQHQST